VNSQTHFYNPLKYKTKTGCKLGIIIPCMGIRVSIMSNSEKNEIYVTSEQEERSQKLMRDRMKIDPDVGYRIQKKEVVPIRPKRAEPTLLCAQDDMVANLPSLLTSSWFKELPLMLRIRLCCKYEARIMSKETKFFYSRELSDYELVLFAWASYPLVNYFGPGFAFEIRRAKDPEALGWRPFLCRKKPLEFMCWLDSPIHYISFDAKSEEYAQALELYRARYTDYNIYLSENSDSEDSSLESLEENELENYTSKTNPTEPITILKSNGG